MQDLKQLFPENYNLFFQGRSERSFVYCFLEQCSNPGTRFMNNGNTLLLCFSLYWTLTLDYLEIIFKIIVKVIDCCEIQLLQNHAGLYISRVIA